MSSESVLVSDIVPATRERLYDAWLSSQGHSAFTGDEARIEPVVGGQHSAFGGYATGRNLELEPYRRIVQSWRSAEFPKDAPDSRLEVTFEETLGGTLVTILHSELPPGQADQCRQGWVDYYLEAMKKYFAPPAGNGVKKAAAPRPSAAKETAAAAPAARKAGGGKAAVKKAAARKPKPKAKAKAKLGRGAKAARKKPRRGGKPAPKARKGRGARRGRSKRARKA